MRPAGFAAKFGCYRSSNVTDRSVSAASNAFLVTAPAPLGARRRALAVAIGLFVVFCALRAVLCLASGFLFTSLIAIPPMLLSSSGPLNADQQTSAWLDTFRN